MEYKKTQPIRLREAGKDEKWLHDCLRNDPSVLGLGDLTVIEHERPQTAGGRLDFLMYDPEDSVRYEIEVMLGTLDESHIIRTIEYWDIERRRFPGLEHRAVIVAEEITNRFFNVISLMNKAIPIIAIQLNAFHVEDQLMLNFVKVLDLAELDVEEEEPQPDEPASRAYWDARADPGSMQVFDCLMGVVKEIADVHLTYNRGHIAIGSTGRHFMWCHPRQNAYLFTEIRVGDDRDDMVVKLQEQGIDCDKHRNPQIAKITLTVKQIEEHRALIAECLQKAEASSR